MPIRLVVIDTQSLFDWLVFRNPTGARWSTVLQSGGWSWIHTAWMRAEFDHVASKGFGERWPVPLAEVGAAWAACGHLVDTPSPPGASTRLHCTDPDDQAFIDLAIAAGAEVLVSRDKALLKLARRARERHGLRILVPAAWAVELERDEPVLARP